MAVAAVLMGVGAAVSALGAIRQGQAMAGAARFNAQMARNNAELARQQAAEEERRFRVAARKQIGAARAARGASGITLEGSPLDVLEESARTAELDALTIRHGGQVRRQAFMNEATAQMFRARSARQGALFGAASSLLLGGSQAAMLMPFGGGASLAGPNLSLVGPGGMVGGGV